MFGWEDKFRRLLLRFERRSQLHYAFKALAYTMINLRHFLRGLILQAMGFMMVALRQHLPRPFNSAMEVHCV